MWAVLEIELCSAIEPCSAPRIFKNYKRALYRTPGGKESQVTGARAIAQQIMHLPCTRLPLFSPQYPRLFPDPYQIPEHRAREKPGPPLGVASNQTKTKVSQQQTKNLTQRISLYGLIGSPDPFVPHVR